MRILESRNAPFCKEPAAAEVRGVAIAVAEADCRRCAAEAVLATAGVAGFPLNPVVVEDDVEVAGPKIAAVDEQQLEVVELVGVRVVIPDVGPIDAKGRVTFVGGVSVCNESRAGAASVDVGEERSNNRRVVAVKTKGVKVDSGPVNVTSPLLLTQRLE